MDVKKSFWIFMISLTASLSCEDKVSIDLEEAPPIIVIDAWINNQDVEQKIVITQSQPYFDSNLPTGVAGATVRVINETNQAALFTASINAGEYTWSPIIDPTFFSVIGERYLLEISFDDGRRYTAKSQINRVPKIDLIKFTFKEKEAFQDEGYEGEFLATDLKGAGDTYWIKAYKNGQFLNKPFELNTAYDAGFSEGGNVDGVVFIQPIQSGVHELDDDLSLVPYQLGDSLSVEIHSITNEAYDFLEQVKIQTQRDGGFDELFAEPFQNVVTNIVSNDSEEQIAGFFCVSAINSKGKKLE